MTVLDLAIADAYLAVGATIGLGNAVTLRIQTWTDTRPQTCSSHRTREA